MHYVVDLYLYYHILYTVLYTSIMGLYAVQKLLRENDKIGLSIIWSVKVIWTDTEPSCSYDIDYFDPLKMMIVITIQ